MSIATADARWSVRSLRERIDSMLYERTALSKQADTIMAQELAASASPQLFLKDPYLLDFLEALTKKTWIFSKI